MTCKQYAVGSNGTIVMDYAAGGVPVILLPDSSLTGSGFCGHTLASTTSEKGTQASDNSAPATPSRFAAPIALAAGALTALFTLVW